MLGLKLGPKAAKGGQDSLQAAPSLRRSKLAASCATPRRFRKSSCGRTSKTSTLKSNSHGRPGCQGQPPSLPKTRKQAENASKRLKAPCFHDGSDSTRLRFTPSPAAFKPSMTWFTASMCSSCASPLRR